MRLTRRQRKERKTSGLSVQPLRPDLRSVGERLADQIADSRGRTPGWIETDLETLNRLREMSGFERITAQDMSFFASKASADGANVDIFLPPETTTVTIHVVEGVAINRSVWIPRHGGGATLTVGGEGLVEIEPMGGGWWVCVGDGDLVNGTLQEAKVRALELLSGVNP